MIPEIALTVEWRYKKPSIEEASRYKQLGSEFIRENITISETLCYKKLPAGREGVRVVTTGNSMPVYVLQ